MQSIGNYLRPLLAAALIGVGGVASATEAKPDPAQAAAEYEKKLDAGLARLKPLAGTWHIVTLEPKSDGQWHEREQAELSFDWILGGRLLETSGHMQNSDFRLSLSYDALKSVYRAALVDNLSGVLDIYEGDFDTSGALIITNPDNFQWQISTTDNGWEMNFAGSDDEGKSFKVFSRNVLTPVGS